MRVTILPGEMRVVAEVLMFDDEYTVTLRHSHIEFLEQSKQDLNIEFPDR